MALLRQENLVAFFVQRKVTGLGDALASARVFFALLPGE